MVVNLAMGAADQVDYWVEQVKHVNATTDSSDNRGAMQTTKLQYKSGPETWSDVRERTELIPGTGSGTSQSYRRHIVLSTRNGATIERPRIDDASVLEEGFYLSREVSGLSAPDIAHTLESWSFLPFQHDFESLAISMKHWGPAVQVVAVDQATGKIGAMLVGKIPRRHGSSGGVYPLIGWEKGHRWDGCSVPQGNTMLQSDGVIVGIGGVLKGSATLPPGADFRAHSFTADLVSDVHRTLDKYDKIDEHVLEVHQRGQKSDSVPIISGAML